MPLGKKKTKKPADLSKLWSDSRLVDINIGQTVLRLSASDSQ